MKRSELIIDMGAMKMPAAEIAAIMKKTVDAGDTFHLVVTGVSMTPTLKPYRDSVELASFDYDNLKRGDIVFAKRQIAGYMLHRIVGFDKAGNLILNGDRQVWKETVLKEDVIAKVISFERNGKHVSCTAAGYRLFVFFWKFTRPFRNLLIKIDRKLNAKDFHENIKDSYI